jgi:hypothetical protein
MRRWHFMAILALTTTGCNRQDVDGLQRIGRKVLDRAQAAASPLREKFDHTLHGIGGHVSIRERVQQRLQWDKTLADVAVEVAVSEKDIELKGTLKSEEQRRRAVELAETTNGVERVTDSLQIE